MNNKYKILVVSSISPLASAKLGYDVFKSLQNRGHEVEMITKYNDSISESNIISVLNEYPKISIYRRIQNKIPILKKIHRPSFINHLNKFSIISNDESKPPVDPSLILEKINSTFDFVVILFWQGLITTQSILDIYNKLKVPILLLTVDMFPLTGGCNYFWECTNFMDNCGLCPGLKSKNIHDITSINHSIKRHNYEKIECAYLGNTWMNSYASKSPFFKDQLIQKVLLVVNESVYKPNDKQLLRKKFNIDDDKKFILFAGAGSIKNVRKGFEYLVKSINLFFDNLPNQDKSNVLLLLSGTPQFDIQSSFDIEVKQLGVLDYQTLADAYAVSNVFLSTSILDAGPSMINQSLMCGTPVVAFKMGVAIDLVISKTTGYCAKYKDLGDYVSGIEYIYGLNEQEKESMSKSCRDLALSTYSYPIFADNIENSYLNFIARKNENITRN